MDMARLKEQLERQEGYNDSPYKDTNGYWTIGIGHLVDDKLGAGLDREVVLLQEELDIKRAYNEALNYQWFSALSDARQNVVINLLFNLGRVRFDKFVQTQLAMSRGDVEAAAKGLENSLWFKQVGRRGRELVRQWRENRYI